MLRDEQKAVRSAAVNGLRLMGPRAATVVSADLIEYLRTRDNPFQTCAALKGLPVELLAPAKADFEAIVADGKLTALQKQDAVDILMRIETSRSVPAPVPVPPRTMPVPVERPRNNSTTAI